MSKCRYDLSEDCHSKDCLACVLDKIRAEIESQREKVSKKHSEDEGLTNYYFGLNDGLKDARDIIDKYKAESEDKE